MNLAQDCGIRHKVRYFTLDHVRYQALRFQNQGTTLRYALKQKANVIAQPPARQDSVAKSLSFTRLKELPAMTRSIGQSILIYSVLILVNVRVLRFRSEQLHSPVTLEYWKLRIGNVKCQAYIALFTSSFLVWEYILPACWLRYTRRLPLMWFHEPNSCTAYPFLSCL